MRACPVHPLIPEVLRKASAIWVAAGTAAPVLAWCAWHDDSVLVVTGPGEQDVPGLAEASTAVVTARGDHGGAILRCPVEVRSIRPEEPDWEAAVAALAIKRLNSRPPDQLSEAWAGRAIVRRLIPTGDILAVEGADGSGGDHACAGHGSSLRSTLAE